ncbi:hypothetical protein [Jiella sp. M17.18]|uniref:hypothetical protein n=1 Tax=Jiella sp. M17.18 TaxID=3234247 RepID=UPI0034DE666E
MIATTAGRENGEAAHDMRQDAGGCASARQRLAHSLVGPRAVLFIGGAGFSAGLTVAIVTIALMRPMQTLERISGRIDALDGMEARLRDDMARNADKVDGLIRQHADRSDARLNDVAQTLGSLRQDVSEATHASARTANNVDESLSRMLVTIADLTIPAPASSNEKATASDRKEIAAPLVAPTVETAVPAPTAAPVRGAVRFERQELADGSVAYRRVDFAAVGANRRSPHRR